MPVSHAVDVNAIVNAHLFGTATAPANADPNQVAASQMPLVLVGTIANTNPELGYAIIGDSPSSAKVYAVGKTITAAPSCTRFTRIARSSTGAASSRPCCCPSSIGAA
jgi:hypothetical protein